MAAQKDAKASTISTIDPKYVVNRQGKDFVMYIGLLEAGHTRGIERMTSTLIQAPTKENGNLAIVQGTVVFKDGALFSALGDASPENVGRMIAPHVTRMAETRSFARALRVGLNVGGTALEELGEEQDDDDEPQGVARADVRQIAPSPAPHPATGVVVGTDGATAPATTTAAPTGRAARGASADPAAQSRPETITYLREKAKRVAKVTGEPAAVVADTITNGEALLLNARFDAALAHKTAPAPAAPSPATAQQRDRLGKLQAAIGRPVSVPADLSNDDVSAQITELVGIFNAQSRAGRSSVAAR